MIYLFPRFLFVLFVLTLSPPLISQPREVITLQSGWKFAQGSNANAFKSDFNDDSWQIVSVPHDWAIPGPFIPDGNGNTAKLPWKGEGWYRYDLEMQTTFEGKRLLLVFDGVMAFPEIFVNGILAGKWDYGYNSFYVDITDLITSSAKNVIAVHADTRMHDSRWYPGAGIYRKVQLIAVDPIHAQLWGTQVTTPILKSNYASVNIISRIVNQSGKAEEEISVEQTILSPAGNQIATTETKGKMESGTSKDFETTMILTNPQRWDVYHGVMYSVVTKVKRGDIVLDTYTTNFGVRTIRFTADDGFYLNDRRVQLKGVNLHHDHGPLGAAFYPRAMERQLQLLKEAGCNAVRTSHNIPAPELLDLCDKLGILVIDEIFDKYDGKADFMEGTDFESFAERNVKNWILRDRNHPSIFLWSVGNEIGDVQWNKNGGFAKLRTMINAVLKYDPSRPTTLVCDSRNSASLRHFDYYDVHSWNYGRRYDLARQLEPNKSVIISESASTVSTRGYYEYPLPDKKTEFSKSLQASSYDLNAPEWAEIPDDDFMWQQDENYIAGEFVWTGFDYLGEPTPYDNRDVKLMGMTDRNASVSSYFGFFDLVGLPKDRYYLYKSYWNSDVNTVHMLPHWNWVEMEGYVVPVFVYTNGDCAELFLGEVSLGMRCKKPDSQVSVDRFRLMWDDVPYVRDELKVIAYKEGVQIGESIMKYVGDPYEIRLTPDRTTITADGMDLSYITIEALDKNGNTCPLADNTVDLKVEGPGIIAGVGNGNPQSMTSFQSSQIKLFYGKAMLILKSTTAKGIIQVSASSKGLLEDNTNIKTE